MDTLPLLHYACAPKPYICLKIFSCDLLWYLNLYVSNEGGFQNIGQKMSGFHILLHLFNLFCSFFGHICDNTRISHTILVLFIQISTINCTILICLTRVNDFRENQPSPILNHLGIFCCNHIANFYLGNLVKGKK